MEIDDPSSSPEDLSEEFLSRGRFYKNDGKKELRIESMRNTLRHMRSIYDQMLQEGLFFIRHKHSERV